MPIPGFSLTAVPEFVTAADALAMVMERFTSSACSEAEAAGWLTEQVRNDTLRLLWADTNPNYCGGLHLDGEEYIFIPGFPEATAIDEFDWRAGELRRRVRYPRPGSASVSVDPAQLTPLDLLARYGYGVACDWPIDEREWVSEDLKHRFAVRRTSLVAALDRASVPLGNVRFPMPEAAEIIAGRSCVTRLAGLQAIAEAAGADRIEVYGKPVEIKLPFGSARDGISRWVWRRVECSEAMMTAGAVIGDSVSGTWSDPYVYLGDLERLARELGGAAAQTEIGTVPACGDAQSEPKRAEPARAPDVSSTSVETAQDKLRPKPVDPRNKRGAMIEGLEKALAAGDLTPGEQATLKKAHGAMLKALGYREAPNGMGDDAFAKHCKRWLKEHGIYG